MNEPTPHFASALPAAEPQAQSAPEQPMAVALTPRYARGPRVWPGLIIVALVWLGATVPGWIAPGTMAQFMGLLWSPLLGTVAILAWWAFASRVSWFDVAVGVLGFTVTGVGSYLAFDPSFNLFAVIMYALRVVLTAWVLWLALTPFLSGPARRLGLVLVFVLAWGYFTLVRFDGVDGAMHGTLAYRWVPTEEARFLAERAAAKGETATPVAATSLVLQAGDWPGFRGANRDGRVTGVSINTDWDKHPPRLLWKQRVGPGWGSFAVVGNRLFTQEQRGEQEALVCYDADTGKEIWSHEDPARFSEIVAGPGPRATPTFHEGKLYAMGAAGRLSCVDAATGKLLWKRDILAESGAEVPQWGYSASPLVAQGVVSVFAGGPDGKSVLAYNATTGAPAWHAGTGTLSYCSVQPARLGGVEQLLLATDVGLTAFQPARGEVLWQYDWATDGVVRVVQPALLSGDDVLLGTGMGLGTRRLHVGQAKDQWEAKEVWKTLALKPYFNDLVIHQGHLYGFDGEFFTCVSLDKGKAKWKQRGYGSGQVLLLVDQGLLLIISETGEVVLLDATPDGHHEHGRFQAITGKTWNHPVIAHGKLFVRNGAEAACYQLAPP